MRFTLDSNILVLSPFILFEVERVLLYPRIQSRYRITALEAARLAQNFGEVSQLVEPRIARRLVRDDPADDYVIYTAAEGKADVLCTLNTRHFAAPEVQEFCSSKGIRVMTDVEALRTVLR